MTTEQILQLNIRDLEKLSEKELRVAVSTLRSTSRKRYERVVESELYSPSVEALRKSATQEIFTPLRGMDITQLRNEFKRYRGFLKSPTSTVKGARKSNKKLRETTAEVTGVDFEDADEMLHYYSLVDQAEKTDVGGVLNYRIVKDVVEEVFNEKKSKRKSSKEENKRFNRSVLKEVEKRLQKYYEAEENPSAIYPSRTIT